MTSPTTQAIGTGILLAVVAFTTFRLLRLVRDIERDIDKTERLSKNEGRKP